MLFPLLYRKRTSDFLIMHTVCYLHYCVTQFTDLVSHTNTLVIYICTTLLVEATKRATGANIHIAERINYLQPARHLNCMLRQKSSALSVLPTIYLVWK